MHRILVTGADRWLGAAVVQRLERGEGVVVYAAGETPPSRDFVSEFQQSSRDGLEFARYVVDVAPNTVVHLPTTDEASVADVTGTRTLLGAAARGGATGHVVLVSDSAVYGAGPRQPSLLTELTEPRGDDPHQRRLAEVEAALLEAAHSDVVHTILRLGPVFGGEVGNAFSRLLSLPAVPTVLGFDPRLQVIHEDDAVAAVLRAVDRPLDGTFNVAGPTPVYLSRILRLGKRVPQPLPQPLYSAALRGLARIGLHVPPHLAALLQHGRVMDTTSMTTRFGFEPHLSGRSAVLAAYRAMAEAA